MVATYMPTMSRTRHSSGAARDSMGVVISRSRTSTVTASPKSSYWLQIRSSLTRDPVALICSARPTRWPASACWWPTPTETASRKSTFWQAATLPAERQCISSTIRSSRSIRMRFPEQPRSTEQSTFGRKNLVVATSGSAPAAPTSVLQILDPSTGTLIWTSPPLIGGVSANSLAFYDLNADGMLEMTFGTDMGMYLTQ